MAVDNWTQTIIAHLELLDQVVSKLPANERLEVKELNRILELHKSFETKFLVMMQLHGFKTQQNPHYPT